MNFSPTNIIEPKNFPSEQPEEANSFIENDNPVEINTNLNEFKPSPKIPEDAITLSFENLTYSVKIKNPDKTGPKVITKEILYNISGICKPGELTAIMGSSGAGKTSLLNLISCRITPNGNINKVTGRYLANGNAYDATKFNKFAGYVMQNDILLETLTPREVFQFTANLRLNATDEEKNKIVDDMLKSLKLTRAADTLIGGDILKGISGGERKRTSIGAELITDPNLLFLDEPTSGLDSFTAFVLINALKQLTLKGKAIIFTIHQPSSDIFFLFDKLMLLAKGRFVYQGSTVGAVDYFSKIGYTCPEYSNPAEYFMDVIHPGVNEEEKFAKMFKKYDEILAPGVERAVKEVQVSEVKLRETTNSWLYTTNMIMKRSYLHFKRNPLILKARIGQTLFFTLLNCSLFWKLNHDPNKIGSDMDINGAIFFFIINVFVGNMFPVILTFPVERAVFLKEYSSNMYSVSSYFFGRQAVELPLAVLSPLIMSAICYYIMQLNDYNAGKFFIFALIQITLSLAGNAIGLFAGCSFSDVRTAQDVAPLFILPMLLFSGFYINQDNMPKWIGWIQWISPLRYAFEALLWNEYNDSAYGSRPLDDLNFELGLWESWVIAFVIGVALRFLALFALKKLVRKLE